jgi:hypothetical protein
LIKFNIQEVTMKKNFGIILAIALGLSALLLTIALQAGWVRANPFNQERAGAPTIVSYQGQIWDGADPYNGTGYFKFAILDATGTTYYWSNFGELGVPPIEYIALPVVNGLFSVYLGDTSLYSGSMTALSADVFDDPHTILRVWFSPDGFDPYTQLPDQKIAAVPYALQAQYAQNSNLLNGTTSSAFQLRVTGSCSVGQAVRAINSNGTVVCETVTASPTFSLSIIDSTGDVGRSSSTAIGTDGLGLISYYDATNYDLKVAHCSNPNCSSATITTLDSTGNVGMYTSIAIGTDGFGLISYYDAINQDLKVAHCGNTFCNIATYTILDSIGSLGIFSHITIGTDGLGLISYADNTNHDLKVAHCNDITCSSATTTALDSSGDVGINSSIAIGTDGLGLISYYNSSSGDLKVAHCNNLVCNGATISTLDSLGDVGTYPNIAIGVDGLGLISYQDYSNFDLKVAHCSNTVCSNAFRYTLDSVDMVGWLSSISIGMDGLGLISYFDSTNGDLNVAHCNNRFCNPDY